MTYEQWLKVHEDRLRKEWQASVTRSVGVSPAVRTDKYRIVGSTHIVEVDPRALRIVEGPHSAHANYVNASFVWWEDHPANTRPYPTSMLITMGRVIKNGQPNNLRNKALGEPAPTFIVWDDGKVEIRDTNDLSKEATRIRFAVTVAQTNPSVRTQGFAPFVPWASIARETNRIGIFYRRSDDKVLLVYRPNTSAGRFRETGVNLKADFGGTLDSGGSANFKVNGQTVNVTSRRMFAGITW